MENNIPNVPLENNIPNIALENNIPNSPLVCLTCHQPISPEWYFCPNCGTELNIKPFKVSVIAQIGIYALSALLPPLGLWPGIKYLGKKGNQPKIVGAISIVLTIVSSAVSIWLIFYFFQSYLSNYSSVINSIQ